MLPTIRYVITLDSDTQLPLDTARELIATMAHPLNRAVIDPATNTVRRGYAILQPRISISMESAARSRLAAIYSGQTGFDPYTTAVSDVYQDLYGQATFTGKGIYDVRAFHQTAGDRFPENTLLSHDLIEGEHARAGLVTDLELIDDYPSTYESYSKRKHRWVRGDWQVAAWLFGRARRIRWASFRAGRFWTTCAAACSKSCCWRCCSPGDAPAFVIALLVLPAYTDLLFALLRLPPPRFWGAYFRETVYHFAPRAPGRAAATRLPAAPGVPDGGRGGAHAGSPSHHASPPARMANHGAIRSGGRPRLRSHPRLSVPVPCAGHPHRALVPGADRPGRALDRRAADRHLAERPGRARAHANPSDPDFLRTVALRTWRYFTDFATPESHWLAPDNVQEDPPARAHRTSPTNLGLQLTAQLAAHDFGYVTHQELAMQLHQALDAIGRLERYRGHFYNWYDTRTLAAARARSTSPRWTAAIWRRRWSRSSRAAWQMPDRPLIDRATLAALRDHCLAVPRLASPSKRAPAPS